VDTVKRILGYLKPYRRYLVATVISMLLLVSVGLVEPQVYRDLVYGVASGSWDSETARHLAWLAVGLLAINTARAGLSFIRSYSGHLAGWGVVADARRDVYAHLQRLSLRYYEDQQTGQLMSRMINDSDYFERLIAHAVPDTLVNVLRLVGVGIVLGLMNWHLMLLTLAPVPLIVLGMRGYAKIVRPAFRQRQQELGELNAIVSDNLSGIREIKAFTREPVEQLRISERIENYKGSLLRALRLMATFGPAVEWSASLGTVIVVYFGGRLTYAEALSPGELVAFFAYLGQFYRPVRQLTQSWEAIQEASAGADRVFQLLDEEPDVDDRPGAAKLTGHAQGRIVFDDVTFGYRDEDHVLEHIDLVAEPGTMTALVGPTGVGKTTMVSLIPRFYDVSGGAILLDGRDIRDIKLRSLRSQIAMVLQDVFLFHGPVRDNILFGRPSASEEEMVAAAKTANAHDFVMSLPDGYDTMIGERGVKLSGGQKQRVSIARAVLKDAPILILDEATSSVDTETEILIQEALERLMVGRTTLVIAHRLSTIRNADQIVVLMDTRIAEIGSHARLMSENGIYRRLIEAQMRVVA